MLMLFVTLMVIAAGVAAPTMAFRVRRDREEEMIHRGTQYSRAIQRFVKKTGRYPSRLEDLENTNNIRFLRRRYKDPITGKDFKLLHVGEVQLTGSPGIAGASPIGKSRSPGGGSGAPGSSQRRTRRSRCPGRAGHRSHSRRQSTRRCGRGFRLSQSGFAGFVQVRLQRGGRDWQRSTLQRSFRRRPYRGRGQHQQGNNHSRVQSQEPLQPVAIHLRPHMDRGGLITTPAQPALQSAAPLQQQQNSSSPNSPGTQGSFGGIQSAPPAQPAPQPQ
jgi:type II secretory pathway pseudopilin PulG